ncbi:MAG: hypothetical protein PHI12_05825 [Dehalococcoidales bacterium]|nr:hypothetical protein [Dehalococcoidales bacterium]
MPAIVGIITGIVASSWLWGIVGFFATLGIVVGIGSRIYRRSTKSGVGPDRNTEKFLNKLEEIGTYKNELPFHLRGWCNALGLYVQLQTAGGMKRLQAGEEKNTKVDARTQWEEPDKWIVTKYKRGSWERSIEPTLEIASFLHNSNLEEVDVSKLKQAITQYEFSGNIASLQTLNDVSTNNAEKVSAAEEIEPTFEQPCIDPLLDKMVKEVARLAKKYDAELERLWYSTTPGECANLMIVFLDELRHNWPREYPQLNPERVPDWISSNLREGITAAYKAGYMRGKGWISQEQIVDYTLYLGDKLAGDLKHVFPQVESDANAFASGYVAVSVQGHLQSNKM